MNIFVSIDKQEKNKAYSDYYGIQKHPFFISEDSIKGRVTVCSTSSRGSSPNFLSDESIKIKCAKIRIIAQTSVHKTVINTSVIQTQKMFENERIMLPFTTDFTFNNFNPNYSSYIGSNCKIEFFVEAIFEKALRTYQGQEKFYFLKPINRAISFRDQTITVHSEKPKIDVTATLDSTYLANNQLIQGQVTLVNAERNSIESAYLVLTAEETVRHLQYTRPFETFLTKYQIIDGTPMPGSKFQYCIQLAALKLWPLQPSAESLIRFKVTVTVVVEATDGESYSVAQSIGLYQPALNESDNK